MADSSVARGRIGGPDFFSDDDPLAELARIAGYEEKVVAIPQASSPIRREPSFNLEDELLREFEQYDEPRAEPVSPAAPMVAAPSCLAEPEIPVAPVEVDPFADAEPVGQAMRPIDDRHALFAPVDHQASWGGSAGSEDPMLPVSVAPVAAASPASEADFGGLDADLIAELETSIAAPPISSVAPKTQGRAAYEPGFRMPLTNFAVAPPRAQPTELDPMMADEPARAAVASTWATDFASDVAAVRARPVAAPVNAPVPLVEPVFAQSSSEVLSLQDNLAQVFEKAETPVDASIDAPEVEAVAPPQPSAPFISPVMTEMRPAQTVAPVTARPVTVERREPEAAPVPDLMDDDFELMLDDLELDLADLMQDEKGTDRVEPPLTRREPVAEPAVPSASVAPSSAVQALCPQPVPTLAPEIPAFLAQSRLAPEDSAPGAAVQPQPVVAAPAFEDADAFDPALLTDAEDMPEAVPDLDVPEIPVHEPEKPVAPQSDFELDLDSELASYLDTTGMSQRSVQQPVSDAKPQARPLGRATAVAAAASASPAPGPARATVSQPDDGLDDFERALEEDFRRSLATPLRPTPIDAAQADEDMAYVAPRRSLAAYAMPLSVAGFVALVGISAYAWYATGKSTAGSDGSPVVIAADSEPVKVVPENPGGKVVPNQDKAVYDRVASGSLNDPKQPSLISSEEQPIDVVQKTLTPENLPLQGEDEAQAEMTPVGDTQDARLLPRDGQQAKPADSEQLAVMPRRVKTMIVRPDGTLVEQVTEVPATRPVSAPATPVATEKVPAAPALAEPTQLASNGPAASSAPTSLSDVNIAQTTALTGTTDVAASTAPAGVPAPKAPVPTARPASQPVDVVASVSTQGTVRNEQRPVSTPVVAPAAPAPIVQSSAPAAPAAQSGGYFIQIASLPSEADAQKSYRNLSSKFAGVIGGRGMDIAKADIAGKGTFYRVRIAAGSTRDEAAALCERYRAAGGTCLIAR